jgi:mRNA-degrading endonuclease toxin of MazEF toxin-antitoxin module
MIQNNIFNICRAGSVRVCAVITNPRRAGVARGVLREPGAANVSTQSSVNISQLPG